jgi:hypothetical protein
VLHMQLAPLRYLGGVVMLERAAELLLLSLL